MRKLTQFVFLPFLILIALIQLGGCSRDLTPEEYIAKAKEDIKKGDYSAASIELSNALQKAPKNADARLLLSTVSLTLGDGAKAEKEIRKAVEFGLPADTGHLNLVKALYLQGKLDVVVKTTESLPANASPAEKAEFLALRGQAFVLQGQFDQAQKVLDEARQADGASAPALVGMAMLQTARRDYEGARQNLTRAREADPNSPEAWTLLGDVAMQQGKFAEAEEAYSHSIDMRRYVSFDRMGRAAARLKLEKLGEAEADVRVLKAKGWAEDPRVNYLAGLIFFREKKLSEAADAFEASRTADPSFLPNRMYLATTQYMLGRNEQALENAKFVLANAPKARAARQLLGAIQISREEFAAAEDVLKTAVRQSPNDASSLRMLATVSLLEGDSLKGVDLANRAAALEPDSRDAQDLLMLAKFMAGQNFAAAGKDGDAASGDEYARQFFLGLAAFRDNRTDEALAIATKLSERYPDRVDPLKLMAVCYLAKPQLDKAKAAFEKVLALDPKDTSAMINLAKIEALRGDIAKARNLLQKVIAEQPDNESAAILLADAEIRLKNPAGGIKVLEDLIKTNPTATQARAKLGETYLAAGQFNKAIEVTQNLNEAQLKRTPQLLEIRGKAQLLTGNLSAAIAAFKELTRIVPNVAASHFYLSDALARDGKGADARKELDQSLKLDPHYLPARIGEVKTLVQFSDINGARKALVKLKQDFGERPEVLGIEGWFALGTRDYPAAEQHFMALMKQDPDSDVAILYARSLWGQKKYDQAISTMQDWLKKQPQDIAVLLYLGDSYMSLNKTDEAIATYTRVIEVNPQHVPSLNNLAWLNRDKDLKIAVDYAQRAYLLAPKDPHVLDTLGMLTLKSGNVARAHDLVQEAAERAPEALEIQLHLGQILIQMQRPAKAKSVLEKVVTKGPETSPGKEAKTLLATIHADAQ